MLSPRRIPALDNKKSRHQTTADDGGMCNINKYVHVCVSKHASSGVHATKLCAGPNTWIEVLALHMLCGVCHFTHHACTQVDFFSKLSRTIQEKARADIERTKALFTGMFLYPTCIPTDPSKNRQFRQDSHSCIYTHIFIYVYFCIYIHIYTKICVYIYMCVCVCVYMYLYIYVYTHIYTYPCFHTQVHSMPRRHHDGCGYLFVCVHIFIYICISVCIHVYTCKYIVCLESITIVMGIYLYMYVYLYIYKHVYVYMHTNVNV